MNILVCFSIIAAVAYGRLTGTVTSTTELATSSQTEKNQTKSFALQYGGNNCIVKKWKNKESTINFQYDDLDWKFYMDTRENTGMTVNLFISDSGFNLGSLNCDGAFSYRDSDNDECWYVPIINGGICNHETGERWSGKIDFVYRFVCPIIATDIMHFKKHGCFYEIGLCY